MLVGCDLYGVISVLWAILSYDESKVDYADLVRFFYRFHDPTTLNRQVSVPVAWTVGGAIRDNAHFVFGIFSTGQRSRNTVQKRYLHVRRGAEGRGREGHG